MQIKDKTLTEKEAHEKAYDLGNSWLERNKPAYNYLTMPLEIKRWDFWLKHKYFDRYKNEVVSLYNTNINYRECLQSTIKKYLSRQTELTIDIEKYNHAFRLSEIYLLEECPVLIPLWSQTYCDFVIYPRSRTKAMQATYDYFLKNNRPQLLREVALKFNHRVKPKPLSFSYMEDFNRLTKGTFELA